MVVTVGRPPDGNATVDVPALAEPDARTVVVEKPAEIVVEKPAEHVETRDTSATTTYRTIGLIATGVGVVGLGIGTVFGISAVSSKSKAQDGGCTTDNRCPEGAKADLHDAFEAAKLSTWAFIAGGVFVAGGLTLVVLAPKLGSKAVPVDVKTSGAGVWLTARF